MAVIEDVHDAGQLVIGPAGPPVVNVSGAVKMTGSTRHAVRGVDGKFVPRGSTLIRPLPRASGSGWVRDTVTGQMIRGQDNSVLFRNDDGLAVERVHLASLGYGARPPLSQVLQAAACRAREV